MKREIFQSPDGFFFHTSKYRCLFRIVSPPLFGLSVNSCQPKSYAVSPRTSIAMMITVSYHRILREQCGRTSAKSFPSFLAIKARAAFGHVGKAFFHKDREQLVHISAVVCLAELCLRKLIR